MTEHFDTSKVLKILMIPPYSDYDPEYDEFHDEVFIKIIESLKNIAPTVHKKTIEKNPMLMFSLQAYCEKNWSLLSDKQKNTFFDYNSVENAEQYICDFFVRLKETIPTSYLPFIDDYVKMKNLTQKN